MKPIAIALTARPSYTKLKPILDHLDDFVIVSCASANLVDYGEVALQAERDFPGKVRRVYSTLAGNLLQTTAKDAGVLLQALADIFAAIDPSIVVVMADRYETLSASIAARYQNIPVAHIQGGERSGNVDDVVRDANSALAAYHFPATHLSALRVHSLTGSQHIYNYGCPSIDLAKAALGDPPVTVQEIGGAGAPLDFNQRFAIVLHHPETEQPNEAFNQMRTVLDGVRQAGLPALIIWPGQDAGRDLTAKAIRVTTQKHPEWSTHTVRGIPPRRFLRLLSQASVLVGNSSAGIREASFLGVPVVNVGERQRGRERASNVVDVAYDEGCIGTAVWTAGKHYPPSTLYGDGTAGERIAAMLKELRG